MLFQPSGTLKQSISYKHNEPTLVHLPGFATYPHGDLELVPKSVHPEPNKTDFKPHPRPHPRPHPTHISKHVPTHIPAPIPTHIPAPIHPIFNETDSAEIDIIDKDKGVKCTGFKITSQEPSESAAVQVSSVVNCINGASSGCSITKGVQYTKSVTSSYSFNAGGTVDGVTAGVTFGMSYTDSTTTSIQGTYSVALGQEGYLSAYSDATLFKGSFTGCKSGAKERPGESLVIRANSLHYNVVNTGD